METNVHWVKIKTEGPADCVTVQKCVDNSTALEAIDTALEAAGIPVKEIGAGTQNLSGYAFEITVVRHPNQRFVTTDPAIAKAHLEQFMRAGWRVKIGMVGYRGANALACGMTPYNYGLDLDGVEVV